VEGCNLSSDAVIVSMPQVPTQWEVIAMRNVTINGTTHTVSSHNQLSDIGLVYRASEHQGVKNGSKIVYNGISHDDLKQVSSIASEGVTGCLQGIKSIANLMVFVNWEDAGTNDIADVAYLISGLCDLGQDMNGHAQWLDDALRATSD
jgi:hypothetical protein